MIFCKNKEIQMGKGYLIDFCKYSQFVPVRLWLSCVNNMKSVYLIRVHEYITKMIDLLYVY